MSCIRGRLLAIGNYSELIFVFIIYFYYTLFVMNMGVLDDFYNNLYSDLALLTFVVRPYNRYQTQRIGVKFFSKKPKKSKVSKFSINKINKLINNIKNSNNTRNTDPIFNKIINHLILNNVPVKPVNNNTNINTNTNINSISNTNSNDHNNHNNNIKNLKDIKNIKKLVTGGFKSYDKMFQLGIASDLLDRNIMTQKIIEFLKGLDKDKSYSVLLLGSQ